MSYTYTAHQTAGMRLNANESSNLPDPKILDTFYSLLKDSELNRYPDDEMKTLRQAFADVYGLDVETVLAGNGSDALLQLMITTFCRDGKTLAMLEPDFGMYRFYSGCIQSKTSCFPTEWDGSFDLDEFARFAKENNAGLVLLSNPNNPTGHILTKEEVLHLAETLHPIVLAADEAYMNFADESLLEQAASVDNLIVTATLSKAWGAAGIRCGFLSACPTLIEKMLPYKIVYSISTLDQLAARAVLAHPEIMKDYVALIRKESDRLQSRLKELKSLESGQFHANFYELRPVNGSCQDLEQAFKEAGIQIRDYGDQERIRITIGLPEENDQVLQVLEACDRQMKEGEAHA